MLNSALLLLLLLLCNKVLLTLVTFLCEGKKEERMQQFRDCFWRCPAHVMANSVSVGTMIIYVKNVILWILVPLLYRLSFTFTISLCCCHTATGFLTKHPGTRKCLFLLQLGILNFLVDFQCGRKPTEVLFSLHFMMRTSGTWEWSTPVSLDLTLE